MSRNDAGIILAVLSLATGFLWAFNIIEYERAVLAIMIMIVFGLIYIGTCCMGILDEIKGKK